MEVVIKSKQDGADGVGVTPHLTLSEVENDDDMLLRRPVAKPPVIILYSSA